MKKFSNRVGTSLHLTKYMAAGFFLIVCVALSSCFIGEKTKNKNLLSLLPSCGWIFLFYSMRFDRIGYDHEKSKNKSHIGGINDKSNPSKRSILGVSVSILAVSILVVSVSVGQAI